jgi:hypothetical protein
MRVAEIADGYDLAADYVVVVGDLNSDPSSWSVEPLVQLDHLYNVNLELLAGERSTYAKTKWEPYPTVTGRATAASDHCAVVADFDL